MDGSDGDWWPFDYGIEVRILGGRGRQPVLRANVPCGLGCLAAAIVEGDCDIDGALGRLVHDVELLRRHGRPDLKEPGATSSLVLTRAERSETEFWTDRGRTAFTAWRIEASGARGAIWAMDEEALARPLRRPG